MMKVIMFGEKEVATPVNVSKIEQMRMDLFLPNLSEVRPHTMEDPILLAMYTEEDTDLKEHTLNSHMHTHTPRGTCSSHCCIPG